VLALLSRHGWNATSFQVLEAGYRYFFSGDDACVAYVDTGGCWVAAGAPIAPREALRRATESFLAAARAAGRRACFFATEQRFIEETGLPSLCIGEQPAWDPTRWSETLRDNRSLREQLRRARAKGVVVRRVEPHEFEAKDSPTRAAIERLARRWLGSRQMAPMGFLVQLSLFADASERRCFIAEREGQLVGVLGMIPVYARNGWFCEDFLRDPAAPNGTVELLVDAAMCQAAESGSRYLTLGLAPLSGAVPGPLRAARRWGSALFDFEGLRAFKEKLRPQSWAPIFLSHPSDHSSLGALRDVLTAFARGGLLRFGLETLLRGPAIVMRVLAALLVPWTLLLVLSPARYFPALWVKWAWVLFDIGLAAALLRLTDVWQPGLATLLMLLVMADALLTTLQVLLYNLPQARGVADLLVAAAAVAGPTLSAFFLWRGRLHRQSAELPNAREG
jgi:phosphatidylglycerol lysyltransferase